MAVLIGAGAHGSDIVAVTPVDMVFEHHSFWDGTNPYILGINNPQHRAAIHTLLGGVELAWVHPDAQLGHDTTLGPGTHVNYAVTMTRTRIGSHCTISPGVTICGDVTIGDRVLIGAGATICDRVLIGDDVTVGAGAVVLPCSHLEAGRTYLGVPAR